MNIKIIFLFVGCVILIGIVLTILLLNNSQPKSPKSPPKSPKSPPKSPNIDKCLTALTNADVNSDNLLNMDEYVTFINSMLSTKFDNYSSLPLKLRSIFIFLSCLRNDEDCGTAISIEGINSDEKTKEQTKVLNTICRTIMTQ